MSDHPKRTESQEMTIVRPRESLPPRSTVPGPTIDQLADVERARRDAASERTTCMVCPWCKDGLVSPEQHAAWLECYPELVPPPPSQPEEPPPPSRPEPPPEAA